MERRYARSEKRKKTSTMTEYRFPKKSVSYSQVYIPTTFETSTGRAISWTHMDNMSAEIVHSHRGYGEHWNEPVLSLSSNAQLLQLSLYSTERFSSSSVERQLGFGEVIEVLQRFRLHGIRMSES